MLRRFLIALAMTIVAAGSAFAKDPDTWDGLMKVKAKRMDAVYLLPDADFRGYTKIMLDPSQMAFRKNWLKDYNRSTMGLSGRVSDADVREALDAARVQFDKIFADAYAKAGYTIVQTPGPDVLRLSTAVINIEVDAPDIMQPGRVRTYSREAGRATLVVEARDSLSGQLLGRALDGRIVGDNAPFRRNSITNRSDFTQLFTSWAKTCVNGLAELRELSPIDVNGLRAKH